MMNRTKRNINLLFYALLCLIIFIFSIYLSPSKSYACSCVKPGTPNEELERNSAVFSGEVIERKDENENKLIQSSADQIAVIFKVDKTWKGISQTETIVYTERNSASCGFEFKLNRSYLVYATEKNDKLYVSICSRTTSLTDGVQDLEELGEGKQPTEQVSVNMAEETTNLGFYMYLIMMSLLLFGWYTLVLKRKRK